MRQVSSRLSATRLLGSKVTLLVAAVAATTLTLTFSPSRENRRGVQNPTMNAEAAYQSLLAQMGTNDAEDSPEAAVLPENADRAEPIAARERPSRNLFAPVRSSVPRNDATGDVAKRTVTPALPRLNGVFIDGGTRQAVIAGTLVAEGDMVDGYCIIEITPAWVLLERAGKTYTLWLGDKS